MRGVWVVGVGAGLLGCGLACGGGAVDRSGDDAPPQAEPTCVERCEARRGAEAIEGDVILAECQASCGVGEAVQLLRSEPGFAVVRGKLDVADLPANGLPLPVTYGIHLDDGQLVALSCVPGVWGGLIGRQVWVRGFLIAAHPELQDGVVGMRDCQELAVVDEG